MNYFLSYRQADSKFQTDYLNDTLSRDSSNVVFQDDGGIPLGRNFVTTIADAICRADVVVTVVGTAWLDAKTDAGTRKVDDPSDFVRQEIVLAMEEEIPLVCALVRGARPLVASRLPAELRALTRAPRFDLRDGDAFESDVAALERHVVNTVKPRNLGVRKQASLQIVNGSPSRWASTSELRVEIDGEDVGEILADAKAYSFPLTPGAHDVRLYRGRLPGFPLYNLGRVKIVAEPGANVTLTYEWSQLRRLIAMQVS